MATQLEEQIRNRYVSEIKEKGLSSDETTSKNTSKHFTIQSLSYPEDLGTKELNQYILFNINIRGKSKIDEGKKIAVVKRASDSANLSEAQLAASKSTAVIGASGTAGLVGGTALSKLFGTLAAAKQTKSGKPIDGLFQSSVAAAQTGIKVTSTAVGVGAGALLNFTDVLKADTTYRISDTIALFISEPPTVKYNAMYDSKDLGSLAGFVGGVSSGGIGGGLGVEATAALAMKAAMVPQAAGIGPTADIISASTKTTLNPFKEVLFTGIDFRSFSFKYKFMPKSKKESEQVKAIVDTFKLHMHPELSENKLFFIYPSEFEITYILNGNQNTYFHKLKPCALESMDITYGGEQYSSFTDGNPTEINLSLTFRELEILTKAQIQGGY